MSQDPMIRKVIQLAIRLLIAGVVIAAIVYDTKIAAGVLCGGALMFGSFLFGGWTASKMGQSGMSQGAAGLVALKLPALGLGLWVLMQRFDAIAVVAGGSVVMLSIVFAALAGQAAPIRKEA